MSDFESVFVEELEAGDISSILNRAGTPSNISGGFGSVVTGGQVVPATSVIGGAGGLYSPVPTMPTPAPKTVPSVISPMPIPQLPAKPTSPSIVAALSPAAMETLKKTVEISPAVREAIAKTPIGFTPSDTTKSGQQSLAAQSEEIARLVVSRLEPRITSMERALESIQQARDFLSEHRERMRRDRHYRNQRENLELTRQVLQAVAEIIIRLESPDLQERAIRVLVNKE